MKRIIRWFKRLWLRWFVRRMNSKHVVSIEAGEYIPRGSMVSIDHEGKARRMKGTP